MFIPTYKSRQRNYVHTIHQRSPERKIGWLRLVAVLLRSSLCWVCQIFSLFLTDWNEPNQNPRCFLKRRHASIHTAMCGWKSEPTCAGLEIQRVQGWKSNVCRVGMRRSFILSSFIRKRKVTRIRLSIHRRFSAICQRCEAGEKRVTLTDVMRGLGRRVMGGSKASGRADHDQLLMGMFLPDLDMSRSSRAATQRTNRRRLILADPYSVPRTKDPLVFQLRVLFVQVCFVGMYNTTHLLWFLLVPLASFLLIGTGFLIAGFIAMINIRCVLCGSPKGSSCSL